MRVKIVLFLTLLADRPAKQTASQLAHTKEATSCSLLYRLNLLISTQWVTDSIDLEEYKLPEAVEVKPGLRVKPMKELRLEKEIKISGIPHDVSD